jgi:uncharacterized repeat protein (TIGR02543 family)/LPXTG-motif cell wall-anchored protein
MKSSKRKVTAVALVSAILAIGSVSPAAQATSTGTMALYFSAPFVTGSHVTASANTEDFNGLSANAPCRTAPVSGSWYTAATSNCRVSANTGTSSGNSEPEISLPRSPHAERLDGVEYTFSSPVKYVGFWWMMGSDGNAVEFRNGTTLVASLNVDEVVDFLGFPNSSSVTNADTGTLITVDGGTHLRKRYYRAPELYTGTVDNPIMNYEDSISHYANEPWVYLNLFVSGDLAISKVKFVGSNFEADNLTVSTVEATPRGDMVFVKGVAGKSVQFLPGASGVTGTTPLQGSNTATTLRSNGFTRSGYTFTGWNTRQDGQGTPYAAGASYSFASDLTLYAQWEVATSSPPSSAPAGSSGGSVSVPRALAATGASESNLILTATAVSLLGFGLLLVARKNRMKSAARNKLSRIELDS